MPSVAKSSHCNFSMLLRRHPSERKVARCCFSAVGALAEPVQRLKWIDRVASVCARCHHSLQATVSLQWGLRCKLCSVSQCAPLLAGGEFLPICDGATSPRPVGPLPPVVIHQEKVPTRVFPPRAQKRWLETQQWKPKSASFIKSPSSQSPA